MTDVDPHGVVASAAQGQPTIACLVDGGGSRLVSSGVDANATFRIASVTKTFTAAGILRLVEVGQLRADEPIRAHLRPTVRELLTPRYDVDAITVDQLLRHTAGVPDHTSDACWQRDVRRDPKRVWSREDQVAVAAALPPSASPGAAMRYSDTGYVLLGEVIETVTGTNLGRALRSLLRLDDLGLPHTWWESFEPPPHAAPARARQDWGGLDVATIDPTVDLYGGGGIVSTVEDLARFFRLLLEGAVVSRQSLSAMLTPTPVAGNEMQMGCGVFALPFEAGGWWGHTGFWNVCAGAQVETGHAVAVCVLRTPPDAPLATDVAARLVAAL